MKEPSIAIGKRCLSSFQQVEDEIVTLRVLEQEGVIEDETVKAGARSRNADAQSIQGRHRSLQQRHYRADHPVERRGNRAAVLSSRLQASVALIEALGGGWDASRPRRNEPQYLTGGVGHTPSRSISQRQPGGSSNSSRTTGT